MLNEYRRVIVERGFSNSNDNSNDVLVCLNGKNYMIMYGEEVDIPVAVITLLKGIKESQFVRREAIDANTNLKISSYEEIKKRKFNIIDCGVAEIKEVSNDPDYISKINNFTKGELIDVYTDLGGNKNPKFFKLEDLKKNIIALYNEKKK